jgi:exodeoxyribonuclease-3
LSNLLQWGWSDLFREKYPERKAFTWWDYRGGSFHRGQGLRIDLLLGNAAVLERVRSVQVDREFRKKHEGLTPSDHAPVIADLD